MVEPRCLEKVTPCNNDEDDENECLVGSSHAKLEMVELGFRHTTSQLKSLQQQSTTTKLRNKYVSSTKLFCENTISCFTSECKFALSDDLKAQTELESWLKSTMKGSSCEFILSGYRTSRSWWECTHSIFRMHNETINIWTHLIGALIWIFMMDATTGMLQYHNTEDVTISILRLCFVMCIFMPVFSSTYHTYKCVSENLCKFLLSLDIIGIHLLMFARTLTEAYVVFYCDRAIWLDLVMICLVPALALAMYGSWTRTQWPFIPAVLLAHVPVISFLINGGGVDTFSPRITRYLTLSLSGSVTGIVAFVLFMYRIPECFYPGKFDIVGSSHQWWHVFTWIGPTLVILGMLELTMYRNEFGCSAVE